MSVADPRQGEIYWASLDPTIGREIAKRRPVLIVSPDDMNRNLLTLIAAPITIPQFRDLARAADLSLIPSGFRITE